MPSYKRFKEDTEENRRTIDRLLQLRSQLDEEIPPKSVDENLLLATWNIREYDSPKYGSRLEESYYYIAEIIARFDLVAVQEVHKDLSALRRLCDILGPDWKYIFTDVTEGRRGNDERLTFLYDSRKVSFGGLAGELVIQPQQPKGGYIPVLQFARTPFICGFTSGWCDFMLATVHILFGEDKAVDPKRLEEIQQVSRLLAERVHDDTAWARNLILLGDFNIYRPSDKTFEAITDEGFEVPEQLQRLPSSALRDRTYDQIAFHRRENKLDFTGEAGVFNYYETVFKVEDEGVYVPAMGEGYNVTSKGKKRTENGKRTYYRSYWRTYQMSDHLPMWCQLKIDYSDEYLEDAKANLE